MSNEGQAKMDILQGTLDLMVLQTLSTMGPLHGYQIAARLEQVSAGTLRLNMGTLYPALMRLEQRGFVRAAWGVTATIARRGSTASPRRTPPIRCGKSEWNRMVSIMQLVFGDRQ
jgi:hypothetical protein